MATIELALLSDHLDESDTQLVLDAIQNEAGKSLCDSDEDTELLDGGIDDDVFTEFRDRLEASDLDADIYVPLEFEDLLEVGDVRVASVFALQLALESLREDFSIPEEDEDDDMETPIDNVEAMEDDEDFERLEDEDEDEEGDGFYSSEDGGEEMKDDQLRHVWRVVFQATKSSLERNLPLFFHE